MWGVGLRRQTKGGRLSHGLLLEVLTEKGAATPTSGMLGRSSKEGGRLAKGRVQKIVREDFSGQLGERGCMLDFGVRASSTWGGRCSRETWVTSSFENKKRKLSMAKKISEQLMCDQEINSLTGSEPEQDDYVISSTKRIVS
ncbi:hypothetical protein KP509_20G088600 [Ceratopteris richardii]|uniref:Uncharacterized protein n=1 Tax=Ceratopteris richardii TaxID=49495 RepID=A0A8T2SJ04_CERRI|nr:hypothetical protein KP509_20G088600 [Ceratopteris richardii]